MVRDDSQILNYWRIRILAADSTIQISTITLPQGTGQDLTGISLVSMGSDYLITYGNENITFYQIEVTQLVYLGSYTFDALSDYKTKAEGLTDQHVIYFFVDPIETNACDPID